MFFFVIEFDVTFEPMHCGTIYLTEAQLSAAVKVQLGFKS